MTKQDLRYVIAALGILEEMAPERSRKNVNLPWTNSDLRDLLDA